MADYNSSYVSTFETLALAFLEKLGEKVDSFANNVRRNVMFLENNVYLEMGGTFVAHCGPVLSL